MGHDAFVARRRQFVGASSAVDEVQLHRVGRFLEAKRDFEFADADLERVADADVDIAMRNTSPNRSDGRGFQSTRTVGLTLLGESVGACAAAGMGASSRARTRNSTGHTLGSAKTEVEPVRTEALCPQELS